MIITTVLLVAIFIYLIPALIARGKKNATAICVLNLFLGWTFLGWIIAFIWACMND